MANKIGKYCAHIISGLLNPFLMPTYGMLLMINTIPGTTVISQKLKLILYGITFIFTCALPLIFIFTLSLSPKFNIKMGHHNDRVLPYFFTAFSVFLGAQLMARLPLPGLFKVYLLGISMMLIVMFFITLKWKISEHTAGIGIVVGTIMAIIFRYGINLTAIAIFIIITSGLLGSLRLYLGKHTITEVFAGFFVTCIGMYITIFYI